MKIASGSFAIALAASAFLALAFAGSVPNTHLPGPMRKASTEELREGAQTFRYDTFGDEAFWGDTLKLHQAIAGAANGGVGPGLGPQSALNLGLKVDSHALSATLQHQLAAGTLDLADPAN